MNAPTPITPEPGPPAAPSAADVTTTTFDRLRAVVTGGHLADMTGAEAKVLLAFVVRADYRTGQAYPAMATVARDAGIGNVHRARLAARKLVARGVLSEVAGSTGRASKVRRIECPPPLPTPPPTPTRASKDRSPNRAARRTEPQSVPVRETSGPESGPSTGTFWGANRAAFGAPTGPQTGPRTHQNTSRNTSLNTSGAAPPFGEEVIEAVYQAYPRKEGRQPALRQIAKALEAIADRPDAPADPVAWLTDRVRRYARERDGEDPRFTKLPAGWFKDRRFDDPGLDDVDVVVVPAAAGADHADVATPAGAARRRPQTNGRGEFKEQIDADALVIRPE